MSASLLSPVMRLCDRTNEERKRFVAAASSAFVAAGRMNRGDRAAEWNPVAGIEGNGGGAAGIGSLPKVW